ncbi:MAG: hypothetical protein JOY98_04205 [Candidatus Eremiobacteraeota bacterium]|nr:hypothetical protein [Candidatus Eremiobacteraeota bacterium]
MGSAIGIFVRSVALALLAIAATFGRARADTGAALPPPSPYVSLEVEASPNYDGEGGSSVQYNWAGQLLLGSGDLLRIRYPVVIAAPPEAITGAGDLSLYDFKVVNGARGQWLAGVSARVPTAQNSSLGSGKYSIGPAGGYQLRSGGWTLGFFAQNYFSIIGPSSRSAVGQSKIAPVVSWTAPGGWSVGLSSMNVTYDWVRNKWTEVPIGIGLGVGIGRVAPRLQRLRPLQVSYEIEQNLATIKDAPGWTTRLNFRWTF